MKIENKLLRCLVFVLALASNNSIGYTQSSPASEKELFATDNFIDFGEQCFSKQEDYLIYTASQIEEETLDMLFPISINTELAVGKMIHEKSEYKYIEDENTKKLRSMLENMRPHVARKNIDYKVFLIEDEKINAWTIPGGYIYFTTGILAFVESDDEIANILGHEIGHSEHKHTNKNIQRQAPLTLFFGDKIGWIVNLLTKATVSFNHHQELESDRTGLELSKKLGYDPKKGLEFWKRLSKNEKQNRLKRLFRSHPYSTARYDCGVDYLE